MEALPLAIQAGRISRMIVFASGTEFYTEYEDKDHHEETSRTKESQESLARAVPVSTSEVHPNRRVKRCVRSTFVLNPKLSTDMIRKLSEESVSSIHPYELDENLE